MREKMKDKIQKEITEWYNDQDQHPEIDDIVDMVIAKTSDTLFDTIKQELEDEFSKGNLEHPFFISNEYYLELKLKDIKNKLAITDNE